MSITSNVSSVPEIFLFYLLYAVAEAFLFSSCSSSKIDLFPGSPQVVFCLLLLFLFLFSGLEQFYLFPSTVFFFFSLVFFQEFIHFLQLFAFSLIVLLDVFMSSLRTSIGFTQLIFRSFSHASAMSEYPCLLQSDNVDSSGDMLPSLLSSVLGTGILAPGFGLKISLGADFWVRLFCVGVCPLISM